MSDTITTAAARVVTDTGGTPCRGSRHRHRNGTVFVKRPDPPIRPSPPRSTYPQCRRCQRLTDQTCRILWIPYPLIRSSLAPSTGAIHERARKSARGCRMTVDTRQRIRRPRPGSEILKERQYKLSAPLHRSISNHGVRSMYEEESDISADEGDYTDTHISHGHLPRSTRKSMDSHAILCRAWKTSRPRHPTPSLDCMRAALEEEEIAPDSWCERPGVAVAVAPCYITPPPTP
jgi:hypothetical protein